MQSRPERRVTASLEVERRAFGFLWFPVGSFAPRPPGTLLASTTESYAQERGSIAETINFHPRRQLPWHAAAHGRPERRRVRHGVPPEAGRHQRALRQTPPRSGDPGELQRPNVGSDHSATNDPQPSGPDSRKPPGHGSECDAHDAGAVDGVVLDDERPAVDAATRRPSIVRWRLFAQLGRPPGPVGQGVGPVMGTAPMSSTTGSCPPASQSTCPAAASVGGAGRVGDQATFVHEIGHGYDFMHTPCGHGDQ